MGCVGEELFCILEIVHTLRKPFEGMTLSLSSKTSLTSPTTAMTRVHGVTPPTMTHILGLTLLQPLYMGQKDELITVKQDSLPHKR